MDVDAGAGEVNMLCEGGRDWLLRFMRGFTGEGRAIVLRLHPVLHSAN